ncbi:hypothetical protein D3C73_605330 [compost metagenome]
MDFVQELHKMSYEDEMRPKVLIHGIKRVLNEKKEKKGWQRLFTKKIKIQPKAWNETL